MGPCSIKLRNELKSCSESRPLSHAKIERNTQLRVIWSLRHVLSDTKHLWRAFNIICCILINSYFSAVQIYSMHCFLYVNFKCQDPSGHFKYGTFSFAVKVGYELCIVVYHYNTLKDLNNLSSNIFEVQCDFLETHSCNLMKQAPKFLHVGDASITYPTMHGKHVLLDIITSTQHFMTTVPLACC